MTGKYRNTKNKTSVKLASYGTAKIYSSNQVRLKASLLSTLGIQPGDQVEILLNTKERVIVIKQVD